MRELVDESNVTKIGIDETRKKGHNYITVVVDLETKHVLYAIDGKDAQTIFEFTKDFKAHKGDPDKIEVVTCDMLLGYKKATLSNFKNAKTIIDKFHVIKHANEAVDKVRKLETKIVADLKGSKYLWLKTKLTKRQKESLDSLRKKNLMTGRAFAMKEELRDIYETSSSRVEAAQRIDILCSWLMHSRLEHMKELCKLIRNHREDILNYFDNRYTNAILEGTNSIIQKIKERSRGFRNCEFFKTLIYLVCGVLAGSGMNYNTLYLIYLVCGVLDTEKVTKSYMNKGKTVLV